MIQGKPDDPEFSVREVADLEVCSQVIFLDDVFNGKVRGMISDETGDDVPDFEDSVMDQVRHLVTSQGKDHSGIRESQGAGPRRGPQSW